MGIRREFSPELTRKSKLAFEGKLGQKKLLLVSKNR
ncbi:MAG: hypothetical protein JWO80_3891 [Bryobacterales bacterium]|nr:hypothetical protein [Bryobacterales bacterium]